MKKIRKVKARDNCDLLNSVEIFKIIQEVLNEEIELEIEASVYYNAKFDEETCGEEKDSRLSPELFSTSQDPIPCNVAGIWPPPVPRPAPPLLLFAPHT